MDAKRIVVTKINVSPDDQIKVFNRFTLQLESVSFIMNTF